MSSPYRKELISKAEKFCYFLQNYSIKGEVLEDSLKDYHIKIAIYKDDIFKGKGVIYYKPSKIAFRFTPENFKDKKFEESINNIWFEMEQNKFQSSDGIKEESYCEDKCEIEIYVDGSFKNNKTGYGAIILKNGKLIKEFSGIVEQSDVKGTSQIAGELESVIVALDWCMKNNINFVKIYYDLENTEKWATGEYKARNPVSQRYVEILHRCNIKIDWQKVSAHSANQWNEYVDKLAKKAIDREKAEDTTCQTKLNELDKIISEFLNFMKQRNINIYLESKIPEQYYSRFRINNFKENNFIIELYHTEAKPLNFQVRTKSMHSNMQIKELCERFKIQLLAKSEDGVDPYYLVKHYYNILKPYETCNFDFIDFANSLQDLVKSSEEVEKYRYNFKKLESIYQEIVK